VSDAINPKHYQFSNDVQLIDITENLNGNGAQAVQYITRATRLDGENKGNLIEDLTKARWFVDREIQRLGGETNPEPEAIPVPRTWDRINKVQFGVEVQDKDGDFWRWLVNTEWPEFKRSNPNDIWSPWDDSLAEADEYAPFTEVIK